MPAIRVDFTSTNDDPIPAGAYNAVVAGVEEKVAGENAKNPGSKMLLWTFEVQEPPEFSGRKLWVNTSLLPQALFTLRNLLRAVDPDNASDYDSELEFEPEDFVGRGLTLEVIQKKHYQDDTRMVNEVKKFLPLD